MLHEFFDQTTNAPKVTIIQPVDQSSGPIGFTVLKVSLTVDPHCYPSKTIVTWSNSIDTYMGTGATLYYTFFTAGKRTLTVTVRDSFGGVGSASITYTVNSVGPTAIIYSPTPNLTFYRNQPVHLNGAGSSPVVFGFPCDRLLWTADRLIGFALNDCTGTPSFNIFTLTVVDDSGQKGTASVAVNFVDAPPSSPPIVTITAPVPGYRLMTNLPVTLSGSVTDPAGGPVTYRWTVFDPLTNKETYLSNQASFSWTPGTLIHISTDVEFRLYGTNSHGVTTEATQKNPVEPPPQ